MSNKVYIRFPVSFEDEIKGTMMLNVVAKELDMLKCVSSPELAMRGLQQVRDHLAGAAKVLGFPTMRDMAICFGQEELVDRLETDL